MPGRRLFPNMLNVAVFILLEVASLCILAKGSEARREWLGRGFHSVMGVIWGDIDQIHRYFNLDKENERLIRENTGLMELLHRNVTESRRNPGPLWPARRGNYEFLPANIVTMTSGSQHNYLVIDLGYEDGIEEDDGIITSQGVIGVIQSVGRNYSYAFSHANREMTVSAKLGHDGVVGSMCWDGRQTDESILRDIPIHTTVNAGDTVFTSGFSSIFPPDIPLGVVVDKKINNGSTADITVKLFEDFRKVSRVIVVRNLDKKEIKELTYEGY